jgi:uncharacterized protein
MNPNVSDPAAGSRLRRMTFAALGVVCTALAGVGIVVPGMPTTVFLIAASYLFARSAPGLDRRLRGSRWFGPYLRRFAESGGMPRRAKALALASMWGGIGISLVTLSGAALAQAVTVALGLAGTATILFYVRTTSMPRSGDAPLHAAAAPAPKHR